MARLKGWRWPQFDDVSTTAYTELVDFFVCTIKDTVKCLQTAIKHDRHKLRITCATSYLADTVKVMPLFRPCPMQGNSQNTHTSSQIFRWCNNLISAGDFTRQTKPHSQMGSGMIHQFPSVLKLWSVVITLFVWHPCWESRNMWVTIGNSVLFVKCKWTGVTCDVSIKPGVSSSLNYMIRRDGTRNWCDLIITQNVFLKSAVQYYYYYYY